MIEWLPSIYAGRSMLRPYGRYCRWPHVEMNGRTLQTPVTSCAPTKKKLKWTWPGLLLTAGSDYCGWRSGSNR